MVCGLFGKMPSKRDFIALNAPRGFLGPFETWLQLGVATSKESLGEAWRELFLQAPIWRFWIGQNIFGSNVAGVMMPSVDGVGRYFPLSAFAVASVGTEVVSPLEGNTDDWYQATENLLLTTLDDGFSDTPEQLASKMELPLTVSVKSVDNNSAIIPGGYLLSLAPEQPITEIFADLAKQEMHNALSPLSFWWTIGCLDGVPSVMVFDGMPSADVFSIFLQPTNLIKDAK